LLHPALERTDGQLLESFVSGRDPAALEALVRRHGPMVWGVCCRVLHNHHDAEDAFQAVFLVLVRRAASIAPRERVGNWLYGVAHQTALKARATAAKQRARERQVADMPEPVMKESDRGDLQAVLDLELSRLPDKYRAAVVLCDLEGKTRKEAARQLGVPEGTLAARVARARTLLAKRLARHGLGASAGAAAGGLSRQAATACVPAAVRSMTIKIAKRVASGQGMGGVAAPVASLTEGVLNAMLMTRVKAVLGIALVLSFLVLGGASGYRTLAADKTAAEPPPDRLADTLIVLDQQWWEAASRHDVDTMSRLLADDWVGTAADGPRAYWDKARYLDNRRQTRSTDVTFLTERRVVRVDAHAAVMSYEVKWRTADRGQEPRPDWGHGHFVHCWVQREGGWFVKCSECVSLPVPSEWSAPVNKPGSSDTTLPPPPIAPGPGAMVDFAPGLPPMNMATAWNKGVRASSIEGNDRTPEKAFDGNKDTWWGSGTYAPGWIERDLGASRPLAGITLVTSQTPACETAHEVWVSDEPIGNDRSRARLVHTFKGQTTNQQVLKFDFPRDLSARYVEIHTTASESWIGWGEIEIRVREEKVLPLGGSTESK
jgi:RNA polymerase sigma factor (sigma-70 family)